MWSYWLWIKSTGVVYFFTGGGSHIKIRAPVQELRNTFFDRNFFHTRVASLRRNGKINTEERKKEFFAAAKQKKKKKQKQSKDLLLIDSNKTNMELIRLLSVYCYQYHTHTWRPPVWPDGLIVFSILATFSDQTLQNSIFFVKVGAKLCPKQNKPSINCQSLRRFRQSCKISPNRVTLSRPPTISSNKLCTLAICRTDSLCHHALLPPLTLYTHSFRVTRILPYSLSLPPFASPHSITNSPSLSLSLCKPTLYDKFTLSHTQSYFKLFISLSIIFSCFLNRDLKQVLFPTASMASSVAVLRFFNSFLELDKFENMR